jgi:hypothetical protein
VIHAGDRRHDRAFDETARTKPDDLRDPLLGGRRHRVQIDVEMIRGQIAGETLRCLVSRCRGDDGKDDTCAFSERARRLDEARTCLGRTRTNAVVFGAVRRFDIEGDERQRACSAKAAREMEARLAKTEESNRCLLITHSLFLPLTSTEPSLHRLRDET